MRAANNTKALSGVVTAQDVASMDYQLLNLGPYTKYFGQPATNVKVMVHGQPGAGKSYFLLQFANWFAENQGSALYVAAEEYGSPTLAEKLKSIGNLSSNLHFSASIEKSLLSNYEYDLVIIDSVQAANLTLEDFGKLIENRPDTMFVLVLQKTKDGNFKGAKSWEHDMDIAAEVIFDDEGNRALNVSKNRYQVMGTNPI